MPRWYQNAPSWEADVGVAVPLPVPLLPRLDDHRLVQQRRPNGDHGATADKGQREARKHDAARLDGQPFMRVGGESGCREGGQEGSEWHDVAGILRGQP